MAGADVQGRTPLHYAALADDADAVSALLSEGADPNVPDRLGFTALHLAAQEGAIPAATTLLAGRAQVDVVNSYGNTPLFTAVFNSRGRGELIRLLRRHGADPRHPSNTGQTPAGLALLIANYDVAQFFTDLTEVRPRNVIHRS
jgi:ankyrin repeat protein